MQITHMVIHLGRIFGKFGIDGHSGVFQLTQSKRCHGGDVYYVFGNLIRQGRPARDDIDVPFSQLIVDLFTSFVRSYDPNPEIDFLRRRNYQNTLGQVTRPDGVWKQVVDPDHPTLRRLDWPSDQAAFDEIAQCGVL